DQAGRRVESSPLRPRRPAGEVGSRHERRQVLRLRLEERRLQGPRRQEQVQDRTELRQVRHRLHRPPGRSRLRVVPQHQASPTHHHEIREFPMKTCLCLLIFIVAFAPILVVAADTKSDAAGFVQLFNGKDLTGWKTHPDDPTKWEVKDGALTASGDGKGHLYSERGDYENLVFRVEAKINDKGNSGQYVRAKFQKGFP